jgi:ribosomal protein S18 acetylase RimI-like enzyme
MSPGIFASLNPILGPDEFLPPVVNDPEDIWLTHCYRLVGKWHMTDQPAFRSARAEDIEPLIDLMLVSSWGGIRNAWERARSPHQTWRDRGRIEIGDADGEIGYSRFVVAESGGRIAGMMLLNLMGDTGRIDTSAVVPEERGALDLIRLARNSLFIREIATAEWARGRGLGREFIALAERIAISNAARRITLIVNDANGPAEKLYRKLGYVACAEVPSIGHPRFPDGSRLLLMEKAAPTSA